MAEEKLTSVSILLLCSIIALIIVFRSLSTLKGFQLMNFVLIW